MNEDTGTLPEAATFSTDAAIVPSPPPVAPATPRSIIPEKLAEHTEALGEAMIQLVAPAAPNEAAQVLGQRLEKVATSLEQIYQDANSSAQSVFHAAEEAFRRQSEIGMRFVEEVVLARSPAEVLKLQFHFFEAQSELFAEQAREMQRQFSGTFLGSFARRGASDPGPAKAT